MINSCRNALRRLRLLPMLLAVSGCALFGSDVSLLQEADEFVRQGRYDDAIAAYREHIAARLELTERPEWENPYFYLLSIGDLQLRTDRDLEALSSYESAEAHHVERGLISDRYRFTASWYEKRGELEKALHVLQKYRDRDPLLFDAMLDRISKELTSREDHPPTKIPAQ